MNKCVFDFYSALRETPELAFQEYQTSAYVAQQLREMGIQVTEQIGGTTAVMGVIPAREPGPVVVLRGDMDALSFKDAEGNVILRHTCGHDAHTAMVLACGQFFQKEGGLPRGELRLLFQPAEEVMGGAKAVLAAHVLDDADAVVGIHLRPSEEALLHQATPALCHSASCILHTTLLGKTAHGARPHQGINAIDAAAMAVGAVNAIHLDPRLPHSVKATKIRSAGDMNNCIPDRVDLWFDLRCQTNTGMGELLEKTKAAVRGAAASIGAAYEDEIVSRSDAPEYDPQLEQLAKESIESVLGHALPTLYTTGGEDFHFFHTMGGLRTAYIGLGAGMQGGLHSFGMTFDPAALEDGVAILADLARRISTTL